MTMVLFVADCRTMVPCVLQSDPLWHFTVTVIELPSLTAASSEQTAPTTIPLIVMADKVSDDSVYTAGASDRETVCLLRIRLDPTGIGAPTTIGRHARHTSE